MVGAAAANLRREFEPEITNSNNYTMSPRAAADLTSAAPPASSVVNQQSS